MIGTNSRMQLGSQIEVDPEDINVTFNDVKGCDEAKQELHEIVEFLKNPSKFSQLGGKLPKGVLLVGPPGNFAKIISIRHIRLHCTQIDFHSTQTNRNWQNVIGSSCRW